MFNWRYFSCANTAGLKTAGPVKHPAIADSLTDSAEFPPLTSV